MQKKFKLTSLFEIFKGFTYKAKLQCGHAANNPYNPYNPYRRMFSDENVSKMLLDS